MLSEGRGKGSLVAIEMPGLSYILCERAYVLKKLEHPSQFTLAADLQGGIASRTH